MICEVLLASIAVMCVHFGAKLSTQVYTVVRADQRKENNQF